MIEKHTKKLEPFSLPASLLLGAATAATQIEGSSIPNSWLDWAEQGKIKDGTSPLISADHWNRYEEDIALMAKMGMSIYRLGIEWSRIEPEDGVFDASAIEHYRRLIKLLQKNKIQVLVTLHHFTNPLWFEKMAAFEEEKSIDIFLRFVTYVVESLKDLVDEWISFNEINVYAVNGYFFGIWPPGKKNFSSLQKVYTHMTISHIKSYEKIHRIYGEKPVRVGLAHHYRIFDAYHWWNPFHHLSAFLYDALFQKGLTKSCATGRRTFPMQKKAFKKHGIKKGNYHDFLGINYYTRDAVRFFKQDIFPGKDYNDLGWEIYPKGLGIICKGLYKKYKKPLYITENGTCDAKDQFRSLYIYEHLKVVSESGLPIERYYHWSFMDNFEWLEGESGKFGLVEIDYTSQKRTLRKSGEFYASIIKERGVSKESLSTFFPER